MGDQKLMRAVVFDQELRFNDHYPVPDPPSGWARIRIHQSGICQTDLELTRGYMGFRGVLGHEFVGTVDACEDASLRGKRVVGEINAACGICEWCARDLGRHCPNRRTLGIDRLDGCMADYCLLPIVNLLEVPAEISDDRAVLTEPLAAACEILEQLEISAGGKIVVLGDGRLGILCAWVLSSVNPNVTLIGHHPEKLAKAAWLTLRTARQPQEIDAPVDIVVDATGSGRGLSDAMQLCKPRGTIVLKSTVASQGSLNLAPIVINEITLLGSRCGQFKDALDIMQRFPDLPLERLISSRYPAEQAEAAFDEALHHKPLKVIIEFGE